jgi:pimeloyl-ACP methyl ester carboxylesterase
MSPVMTSAVARQVAVPGGSLYYLTRGRGPVLLLMGGGPSNADTLEPLAAELAGTCTVVTYDRRGYSRSVVTDPAGPDPAGPDPTRPDGAPGLSGLSRHAADARRLIAALGGGPVSVFGTSFGALVALELAAADPAAIGTLIVHEPPLGQLLAGPERPSFDLDLGAQRDAAALDAIAASVGARRGSGPGRPGAGPVPADVELFIRRDAPAIGRYHLDLAGCGRWPAGWSWRAARAAGTSIPTGAPCGWPASSTCRWPSCPATTPG